MTNTKFTPGPWNYEGGMGPHNTRLIYGPDKYLVADAGGAFRRPEEESKANARLIAASPVLLAACQTAFDALESAAAKDQNGPQAKALAQLRTAIYTAIPE